MDGIERLITPWWGVKYLAMLILAGTRIFHLMSLNIYSISFYNNIAKAGTCTLDHKDLYAILLLPSRRDCQDILCASTLYMYKLALQ